MRDYLDQMSAPTQLPAPDVAYPRIIGANGPKMLALASHITDGAMPELRAVYGKTPLSEDDLTYSLVMTDHYFSIEDLEGMSAAMLSGKPRPSLPPEQEAQFKEMLRTMEGGKLMKNIERMNRKAEGLT